MVDPRPFFPAGLLGAARRRRTAGLALAVLLFLVPAAWAQGPVPASFFLETISVAGEETVSPELLISESLLEEGETYTEAQLRHAVHRINRLPFILEANFSLEKGSERDRYELVITVKETRRWFFGAEFLQIHFANENADDDDLEVENLLAGRRFFLGKHGVGFIALGSEDEFSSVGYTHYDLFGRGVVLDLSYSLDSWSSDSTNYRTAFRLGVPLRTNQSLLFATVYDHRESRSVFGGPDGVPLTSRSSETDIIDASLAWTYNSLDDPVLPTEGFVAEGGLLYNETSSDSRFRDESTDPPSVFDSTFGSEVLGIRLQARKHWPTTARQSLWLGGLVFAGVQDDGDRLVPAPSPRFSNERDVVTYEARAGYDFFLLRQRDWDQWRELRWETTAEARFVHRSPGPEDEPYFTTIGTGLAYRNAWGVFRLRFEYQDEHF